MALDLNRLRSLTGQQALDYVRANAPAPEFAYQGGEGGGSQILINEDLSGWIQNPDGSFRRYVQTGRPGEIQEQIGYNRPESFFERYGAFLPPLAAAAAAALPAIGAAGAGAEAAGAAGATGASAAGAGAAGAAAPAAAGTAAGAAGAGTLGSLMSSNPYSFLIPAASNLIGAALGGNAATEAASTSAAAADRATDLQRRIYEESIARQQPFLQTGTEAFNRLAALQRGGPEAAQNFLQMDPGYGFRLGEGMKALERSAAARGGLMSGATGKALQRYGQDVASQEFGAAYNRLAGLANVGPQSAGVMSTLGQNYGANVGNMMAQQGVNSANALMARGSMYQRGLGDIGYLAGRYLNQPASAAATPSFATEGFDYGQYL